MAEAGIVDNDEEKGISVNVTTTSSPASRQAPHSQSFWSKWNARIESLAGFEARGLERVAEGERLAPSWKNYLEILLLWLSSNMTIICTLAAVTGPTIFQLGFKDSTLCVVFGTLLGATSTAYMSTWGAATGARTMIVARFMMGWWPSRLCALLNIILMIGYCTLDNIVGGQVLSAVSGGGMSIAVGVVIVAIIMGVLAVFGLRVFHQYLR